MAFNGLNVIKTDITSEEHCILYPVVKTQPSLSEPWSNYRALSVYLQSTYSLLDSYFNQTNSVKKQQTAAEN